jgi:hypothetical protein
VLRLFATLEQFVVTACQVNTLTNGQGILDAPANLLPIANSAEFDTQAQVADETATAQMEAISAAGLDPSYGHGLGRRCHDGAPASWVTTP